MNKMIQRNLMENLIVDQPRKNNNPIKRSPKKSPLLASNKKISNITIIPLQIIKLPNK